VRTGFWKGRPEGKEPTGRQRPRWKGISMSLQHVEWEGMDWVDLAQGRDRGWECVSAAINFFKEIYCTENSWRYTRLQNCSFNQFAIVVIRRARDRVSTVLGMYKCSSEKQVQREKTLRQLGEWL